MLISYYNTVSRAQACFGTLRCAAVDSGGYSHMLLIIVILQRSGTDQLSLHNCMDSTTWKRNELRCHRILLY